MRCWFPAHQSVPAGADTNPEREQEMIRTALADAVLAVGATALEAQSHPLAARKRIKKANGDHSKIATDMLEGKAPFNLDAAKKVFVTFAEAEKVKTLFPDDSKTGGDTATLPALVGENAQSAATRTQ